MQRKLEFTSGPFGFDAEGSLRCSKCNSPGVIIAGSHRIGVSWAEKEALDPKNQDPLKRLPSGWVTSGIVETDHIDSDEWTTLFKESWLHVRHVETQRLGYASLYGGVTVLSSSVSFFFSSNFLSPAIVVLCLALATYSGFQFLLAEKLAQAIEHDQEHLHLLLMLTPKNSFLTTVGMQRPMDGMIIRGRWEKVKTRWIIPRLYLGVGVIWLIVGCTMLTLAVGPTLWTWFFR